MPGLRLLGASLLHITSLAVGIQLVNGQRRNQSPADCQAANQFLCQEQCGKVLIHCTGPGTGVPTQPLDEPQAVCNNGVIDFAANCIVGGGTSGGSPPAGQIPTQKAGVQGATRGGSAAMPVGVSCAPNKDDVIVCLAGECQPFFTVCNKGNPSAKQPTAPGTVCKSDANGIGTVVTSAQCRP